MEKKLKILMVEDVTSDAELIKYDIRKSGLQFTDLIVENKEDYVKAITEFYPDIILSDYSLPAFDGMQALLIRQELAPTIPFILVTGSMNEEVAVEIMKAGADDYVIKQSLSRLSPAIKSAIERKEFVIDKLKAEAAVKTLAEQWQRTFDSVRDGICLMDKDMRILQCNHVMATLLHKSEDELKGKQCWEVVHGTNEVLDDCPFLRMKKSLQRESTVYNFDDQWFDVTVDPILDKDNILTGVVHVFWNITDRKQIESELIAAKEKAEESDRLKTAFLHNISHEIRTPMNAIVGFSSYLNNTGMLPEKCKYYTDIIMQSSNYLLSIITDIINIATIEAGQEKINEDQVNLNSICSLIHNQFISKAHQQKISLCYNTALPDNEVIIITDEIKLTQILSNLVDNAIKFTKHGSVRFGYKLQNNELEFHVEDTGIGIPLNMFDEIFRRFRQIENSFTQEYGGSGLGLSISKAYIELLGGKIWLESKQGKGSIFYFTIPLKRVRKKSLLFSNNTNEVRSIKDKALNILIADNEDFNFMLINELLADYDVRLTRAVNGLEAVEICKKSDNFDLILMDLKMPEMDGYEASKLIKEFRPELTIIAQTAYTSEADKHKAFESGCSDLLTIPFTREQLLLIINNNLDKKL